MRDLDHVIRGRADRLPLVALLAIFLVAGPSPEATAGPSGGASEKLTAGRAALEDGLYELAEKQFAAYLGKVKKGTAEADEVTILLARSLHGQKKYEKILRLLSPPGHGQFALWRATARYELGEHEKALAELSGFEKHCEDKRYIAGAERIRARCHLGLGDKDRALAVFAAVEAKYADVPEAAANLLDWARVLIQEKDPDGARRRLVVLIGRFPGTGECDEGRLMLGRLLIGEKKWEEAEKHLLLLANAPKASEDLRALAYFSMSAVHQGRGKMAEAAKALRDGIEQSSSGELKRKGQISLGRLFMKSAKVDDGAKLLRGFIAATPPDSMAGELQLEIAQAYLAKGDGKQASMEFQHYLDTFSDKQGRARAFRGKGWSLLSLSVPSHSEASAAFQKAYELFDAPADKAEVLFKVADSHFANKKYKLAMETYKRVTSEFPGTLLAARSEFQVAESMARAGEAAEAEELFRAIVAKDPGNGLAERSLLRCSELEESLGHQLAALAGYEKLMETYTNGVFYVNALHAHGLICYRLLRFEQALSDFERVVRQAPESELAEQAFYMRGWCHQMLGRDRQALSTCEDFVRRFPQSKWTPAVMFWIGEYEFNHSEYARAEKQFLSLAAKYPDSIEAESALLRGGQAAARQKEYLRATEHFAALAKAYPQSGKLAKARYSQGDALCELGKFPSAILVFEEVIKNYRNSYLVGLAWGRKGDCQFGLARHDEAMASYQAVVDSKNASKELRLQAQYKIGRCLQKVGKTEEALEQYYVKVVGAYLDDKVKGKAHNVVSDIWFTRAVFDAAEILEAQKKWGEAVKVLKRIIEAGLPAEKEAQEKINRVRLKQWRLVQ